MKQPALAVYLLGGILGAACTSGQSNGSAPPVDLAVSGAALEHPSGSVHAESDRAETGRAESDRAESGRAESGRTDFSAGYLPLPVERLQPRPALAIPAQPEPRPPHPRAAAVAESVVVREEGQ